MMRSPIPPKIREELSNDPYMVDCIIGFGCDGRIEWHHAFNYAGKRQNELWSILPVCKKHHDKAGTPHVDTICKMNMRARIYKFNAIEDFRTKFPRSNLLPEDVIAPTVKRGRPVKI